MTRNAPAPHFIQTHLSNPAAVRAELEAGLLATPAHVSPKYFYDALGSRLFDAITELPEYYPTRTEAAIFGRHGAEMAAHLPAGALLVDLGAGSCAKAASLFPELQPAGYVAVDISVDYLRDALGQLQQRHPALPMLGLGMDFSTTLQFGDAVGRWLSDHRLHSAPRTVFYPGSSIGNFIPAQAVEVLEPAYDDALGVTAAFNRNLLLNVNRWMGSNFQPVLWRHVAHFNAAESRIEMHLEALQDQTVVWEGGQRRFVAGERMHTENSCKWTPASFETLLEQAGWRDVRRWTDKHGWFGVFAARA
ncbi:MAG: L-histidine N(alpha)-methyltransferase [Hydrogenophaga sp.]|nr:L-histidine N(alpha)-methyltransferase [Hydrogenophaga sp.]